MSKEIYVRFPGRASGRTTTSLLRDLDGAMQNDADRARGRNS